MKGTYKVEGIDEVSPVEPQYDSLGRYSSMNLIVISLQIVAWFFLLNTIDQHSLPLAVRVIAVFLFCMLMQGVFTMVHEFCHRNAHHNKQLNYLIGCLSSTLFGTSATFLRVQHWGHHRRNRTEAERAEFIHDDESKWGKIGRYYFAILGGIWFMCFLFPMITPFIPYSFAEKIARDKRFNTYSAAFEEFTRADWLRMRVEGGCLFVVWALVVFFGPWHGSTFLLAYGAFAFSWSTLQWVYHLHTPIHVVEGAYNLRAPWLIRALFLNFNYNLTHHRHPAMPWQELYRKSNQEETQPLWYRYLLVFRPPVVFPQDVSKLEKRYF
ncbi:Fatty acid desaturase [Legionella moravica]|uniref:Fatty acid desaturase n=1 Tax=Legionella moravica TaxID=39962 RepID=A0A378K044_9GAMM|nr:fatty acid desaturase [Legionella moravica]KTD34455.1 Fatty acid desaturase [Legionella moravica]STX64174.1 Fatty acid desaturase [Legionella moravica]